MAPRSLRTLVSAALLLGAASACAPATPVDEGPKKPPGLYAAPERLAFLCVTPGCDSTQTVHLSVVGNRRVAIKRILLAGDAQEDFTFTTAEPAPFILGENSGFDVEVKYVPKGAPIAGAVELRVTYTDASAEESPDRLEPGELAVPLVRRLVGEPVMTATPQTLSFGVVAAGETKTLPLGVKNDGFGNIALELTGVETMHDEVSTMLPETRAMASGESVELPVTYSPVMPAYVSTELVLHATPHDVLPQTVKVEGTSLAEPRIGFEPGGNIDFGELEKGKQRVLTTHVMNQGGLDLTIQSVTVLDASGNVTVALPNEGGPLTITPLERVPITITIDGVNQGEVDATLTFASDDPRSPSVQMVVTGLITEPAVTLTPAMLDFGTVPVGWVLTKPVEIKNTGYGDLTVKNVTLVAGSSNLFTLMQLPALPVTLKRDQRIAVDVEFRAETQASFSGWLSVETDDPANAFVEVPLTATVGSCMDACPIANGTPSCNDGTCGVGACNSGFYDTDKQAATGCECKEVGTDPGSFCADGIYKGSLNDGDGDQVTHTGVLPVDGDIDILRFFAKDSSQFFDDDWRVKVRLTSTDPSIKLCVYRHDTGSHQNECYFTNEVCPSTRYYQKNGSLGSGDDADFTVKVFRDPNVAPTCTTYTLFMSNGL